GYSYCPTSPTKQAVSTAARAADAPGYLDGQVTAGNVTPVPNSVGLNKIHVTQGATDSPNNDFAEIKPSSLSGVVWFDANDNGSKGKLESGIGQVALTLTGTNDLGQPITLSTTTASDGSYSFGNLRPGTYTIKETPPSGYLDGNAFVGTQGGVAGKDQLSNIQIAPGTNGVNNNF